MAAATPPPPPPEAPATPQADADQPPDEDSSTLSDARSVVVHTERLEHRPAKRLLTPSEAMELARYGETAAPPPPDE